MKRTICILLAIFLSCNLSGQYDDMVVNAKLGFQISLNELGNGSAVDISLQKHLALGVYGLIGYRQGHVTEGDFYSIPDFELVDEYFPNSMHQFSAFGLGLKKVLQISSDDNISLSFTGLYIRQKNINWELALTGDDMLDLFLSQERYTQRTDLGFSVAIDYSHRVSNNFGIGVFADYLSRPRSMVLGLQTQFYINQKEKFENSKGRLDGLSKNGLELRINSIGGDGTDRIIQYDVEYNRTIWKSISAYAKFSTGQKSKGSNLNILSDDELEIYRMDFLGQDHEGDPVWLSPIHSTSYGLGLRVVLNADGRSTLSLSGGALYYKADVVRLRSSGGMAESWQESFEQFKQILPELGLYYDFDITQQFYIGTKISLAFNRMNIGIGLHAGTRF